MNRPLLLIVGLILFEVTLWVTIGAHPRWPWHDPWGWGVGVGLGVALPEIHARWTQRKRR